MTTLRCSYRQGPGLFLIDKEIKQEELDVDYYSFVFDKPERVFYKHRPFFYRNAWGLSCAGCRYVCRIKTTLFISSLETSHSCLSWSRDGLLCNNGGTMLVFYTLTYAKFLNGVFS
jgi:hypothetical protein